ncbi:MAG: pyruvate kinase [Lachnospiraceae bacterium]|nr:pyruvate kinase [Lachnospiraceae bacterium]
MDIYGTLGPSCAEGPILVQMFQNGMTGIRLNLSHISLPEAADQIKMLHEAAEEAGVKPQLLIDMQGPELRVGRMSAPIWLENGGSVYLSAKPEKNSILISKEVFLSIKSGQELLLDDGKLLREAVSKNENRIKARVIRGGVLAGRKSIALVGKTIDMPPMTADDLANIREAKNYGVTAVMQPFVRNREDLMAVRSALDEAGSPDIRLFAKIENMDGVRDIDELIPAADEIVIARGDLGNAVPLPTLPAVQKRLAKKCREAGKPFMVVTQMLASMEKNPVPTRAEVSDIFNAVLDGAASVMVTGETAAGRYPAETIRYLAGTVRAAEQYMKETKDT